MTKPEQIQIQNQLKLNIFGTIKEKTFPLREVFPNLDRQEWPKSKSSSARDYFRELNDSNRSSRKWSDDEHDSEEE